MSNSGEYLEVNENENQNENDSQEQVIIVEDDGDDLVARGSADDGYDPERAAIRERRRKEKAERKERKEKAITRDKLELDYLRKRNDDLERRLSTQEMRAYQADLQNIDAHFAQAQREVQMAENVIAKASSVGNGEDVVQAIRYRDEAIAKAQQLAQYKQQAAYQAPQMAPVVDDMVMHHAKEFLEENPWYDMQGRDEASAIVLAIDQSLAKEGLNPQSEDYWDELRARVAKRLPDKLGKGARRPRGGPSVGSGREYAPSSTRKEVYISAERKQALIEAGVWDDPVLRMKYVKRYAQYDRDRGE